MMKRGALILLTLVFLLSLALPAWAAPTVIVDGKTLSFGVPPRIEQWTTLVPLRGIFEALGANVEWDGSTQTVKASKADTQIQLKIGSTTAYRNGVPVQLSVPGKVVGGSTLVPLRFVSEALGADVHWNGVTETITIASLRSDPAPVQTTGTLTWPDGPSYTGDIRNGQPHGQGTMVWPNGGKVTGNWENGLVNGQGIETHPDGFRYEGNWVNGKPNGLGSITLSDGFKYTGNFKDGRSHGLGTGIWPDGSKYVGQWQNGQPHGQGTYTWPDGYVLSGVWVNGTPPKLSPTLPVPTPNPQYGEEVPRLDWQQTLAALTSAIEKHRVPYQPPFQPGTPMLRARELIEAVYLQKVMDSDNKAIIVRSNGDMYLIEYGVGVSSLWLYEGKTVHIYSPGLFAGIGSKIMILDRNQSARIWDSDYIGFDFGRR